MEKMLVITKGSYINNINDRTRNNTIMISQPYPNSNDIISIKLNFDNINLINDYIRHIYLLMKSLIISINRDLITHNEIILRELDSKIDDTIQRYNKISLSTFINSNNKYISTTISLGYNESELVSKLSMCKKKLIKMTKILIKDQGWGNEK